MNKSKKINYSEKNFKRLLYELKNIYNKKRIIFFLGAGIDKHIANIPTWNEFKHEFKIKNNFDNFQNIYLIENNWEDYKKILNNYEFDKKNQFFKFIDSLKQLSKNNEYKNNCTIDYITTNNSNVIEKNLRINKKRVFTYEDNEFFKLTHSIDSTFFYVHGKIENDTSISSFDQYYNFFTQNKFNNISSFFQHRFFDKNELKIMIIIGSSLSEPHLLSLFWKLIDKGKPTAFFYINQGNIKSKLNKDLIKNNFYWININKIYKNIKNKNSNYIYNIFYKSMKDNIYEFINNINGLSKSEYDISLDRLNSLNEATSKKELKSEIKKLINENIEERIIYKYLDRISYKKNDNHKNKLTILKYLYNENKLNFDLITLNIDKSVFSFLEFYINKNKNEDQSNSNLFWIKKILQNNNYKTSIDRIKNIIKFIENKIEYTFSYDYFMNMILPDNGIINKLDANEINLLYKKIKIKKINVHFDIINSFFKNVDNSKFIKNFKEFNEFITSIKNENLNNIKNNFLPNYDLIVLIKKYNLIEKNKIEKLFNKIKKESNKNSILKNIHNIVFNIYYLFFNINEKKLNVYYKKYNFFIIKKNIFCALDVNSSKKYFMWQDFKEIYKNKNIEEFELDLKNNYPYYCNEDPFFIEEILRQNFINLIDTSLVNEDKLTNNIELIKNKINDIFNNDRYKNYVTTWLSNLLENKIFSIIELEKVDNFLYTTLSEINIDGFELNLNNNLKNELAKSDLFFKLPIKTNIIKKSLINLFFNKSFSFYYSCIENQLLYEWIKNKKVTWNFIDNKLKEKINLIIKNETFKIFYFILFEYNKYSIDDNINIKKYSNIKWLSINEFIKILSNNEDNDNTIIRLNCYEGIARFIYKEINNKEVNHNKDDINNYIYCFLKMIFDKEYKVEMEYNDYIFYRFSALFNLITEHNKAINYFIFKDKNLYEGIIENIFFLRIPDKKTNLKKNINLINKIKDLYLELINNIPSSKTFIKKIDLRKYTKKDIDDIFLDEKTIKYNSFLVALKYFIYSDVFDYEHLNITLNNFIYDEKEELKDEIIKQIKTWFEYISSKKL